MSRGTYPVPADAPVLVAEAVLVGVVVVVLLIPLTDWGSYWAVLGMFWGWFGNDFWDDIVSILGRT